MNKPNLSPKVCGLPHKPGVYIFKDRLGRIIYVGKARDLHRRVSQYFHPSRRMKADLKTRALVHSVWDLETHVVKSDPEAILLEGRLIKEYRPRYNISFRDDKRFLMLKINLDEPLPRFQLTRLRKEDGNRYFGPFAHSGAVRATLELMKKKFHLRSCKPRVPGAIDYKHCLDHIIKNCSAPCIQKISREEYGEQVQKACEFLEGKSAVMQTELETEMKKAAAKLDFEKASQLRDMLDDIRKTTKPQRRYARQLPTTIIPERDLEELRDALHLPTIPQTMECFDISNISSTHKVASMVCFCHGRPDNSRYRRYRIKTVEGQDDFASMAEVVSRRYARVLREGWKMPDLVIVDGGMGQLSAALRELGILGLSSQPVIGLAKQREEIYLPHKAQPLLLPRTSGAIHLLQRIRDEAHRVANSYHQLLMKKRISESVLDECPGISRAKKTALLRHFGSVAALRKESVEEIAQIKGISLKLAEGVRQFLNKP